MSETLTPEQATAALTEAGLAGWTAADGRLRRDYATAGWPQTLMVVGAIGLVAEAAWHHPDLEVSYARVTVHLTTHDAGGLTAKDVATARAIEDAVTWRPPAGSALGAGSPDPMVRADA
ncbi:MAG: 4a-hydroxytetrahydrobiopterin dehydratase [Solirubrobacteraceae bacterium]|nr:4a-hydroxytetrahydrobiopterin dehydratase [Solirubrobacteraceae bacterium]